MKTDTRCNRNLNIWRISNMSEQKYPIKGGFFNSIAGDRKYNAEEMNRPYKRIISEGIFATPQGTPSTDLQVLSADDGMNIIVKAGDGLLGEKWFENPSDLAITVANNTSIVPRIDSIIIQVDNTQNGRICNVVYREGEPNSNAEPPIINNIENIIEKRIANIRVAPSTVFIGQDLIYDLRGSSECPWITSLIKQVDTSTLFLQWETAYENFYNTSREDFENWFENLKNLLDENIATKLQTEINNIKENLNTKADTPRRKILTLLSTNWTLNTTTNKYEYIIEDNNITENDFADCLLSEEDKKKLSDLDQYTEEGRLILITSKQVTENINMTVVLIRTVIETEVE